MKKLFFLFLILLSINIYGKTVQGTVLKVFNCERFLISIDNETYIVKLYGIKDFNIQKKLDDYTDFINKKVHGQKVYLYIREKNKNTITARVQIKGSISLNQIFLENGWAKWDQEDANDNLYMKKLEEKARDLNKGYWMKMK